MAKFACSKSKHFSKRGYLKVEISITICFKKWAWRLLFRV